MLHLELTYKSFSLSIPVEKFFKKKYSYSFFQLEINGSSKFFLHSSNVHGKLPIFSQFLLINLL